MTRLQRCVALFLIILNLYVSFAETNSSFAEVRPGALSAATSIPGGVQSFFERRGSVLASTNAGDQSAATLIEGYSAYYSLDPRVLIAVLELVSGLVSADEAPVALLERPFGPSGPQGFKPQIEWAVRELRAGLGPYEHPPVVSFSDGRRRTLPLEQEPTALSIARLLAQGRSEPEWLKLLERYGKVYDQLFGDLPLRQEVPPPSQQPFLADPWPPGTEVIHTSWFDHVYPTVDIGGDNNHTMIDYLGRSGNSYNSHDGHDFYFPDMPYGTPILAAAAGWAYARSTPGNGVVIRHAGALIGYETVYWHLADFSPDFKGLVDSDEPIWVERGAFLGWSGASGFTDGAPHLHFEVRRNGKQVDPFGWYGPGDDPCAQYAACETSVWLWLPSSIWPAPHGHQQTDQRPPTGLLALNPDPSIALLANFDGTALPEVGEGMLHARGVSFGDGHYAQAASISSRGGLSFQAERNLKLDQGSLSFWAELPERYPALSTGRNYLLAASNHPSDPRGVYSDTFALRREEARGDRPALWNFWTVDTAGLAHSLTVSDTLSPGWHHFTLRWSHEGRAKSLLIDGRLVAEGSPASLPGPISGRLELGRWYLESGYSAARFDQLVIWRTLLEDEVIAELAQSSQPVQSSPSLIRSRELYLVTQASDDGRGIVQVQLGIDGRFGPPQPYFGAYRWSLPPIEGPHSVTIRYVDGGGNTTAVTRTVELDLPPRGQAQLLRSTSLTATVALTATDSQQPIEVLLSQSADTAEGAWQPLARTLQWSWQASLPRTLYVRFRDAGGAVSAPIALK